MKPTTGKKRIVSAISALALGAVLLSQGVASSHASSTCTFYSAKATNAVWYYEGGGCASLGRTGVDSYITENVAANFVYVGARIGTSVAHAPGTHVTLTNRNGGRTGVRWHSSFTTSTDRIGLRGRNHGVPSNSAMRIPQEDNFLVRSIESQPEQGFDASAFVRELGASSNTAELLSVDEGVELWTAREHDKVWLIYHNPETQVTSATSLTEEEWANQSLTLHVADVSTGEANQYHYLSPEAGTAKEVSSFATRSGLTHLDSGVYVDTTATPLPDNVDNVLRDTTVPKSDYVLPRFTDGKAE